MIYRQGDEVPETEIAWAAGFFDGEGNTCAARGGRALCASVAQVNRCNLHRFKVAVGGLGHIHEPFQRKNIKMRPISKFAAYGDEAFAVMRRLFPYLGEEKQTQFMRAAISYGFRTVEHRAGLLTCARGHVSDDVGRYRGDCNECRRLRRTGLPMPPKRRPMIAFQAGLHIRQYKPMKET